MVSPFLFKKGFKMENCKIINVSQEDIPEEYYNKNYAYFSFGVMNDRAVSLSLVDSTAEANKFLVIDLRGLTPGGREKFRAFLRSITVNDDCNLGLDLDFQFARRKFGVTIKRRQRKEKI